MKRDKPPGKALEDEFFQKQEKETLSRLRESQRQAELRELLAEASGIQDPQVLEALAALDIRPETLAALALVPLVAVAWADGVCEHRERKAVLRAAENSGLGSGDPSYQLLDSWLTHRPPGDLLKAWKVHVAGLAGQLDKEAFASLKADLLGRARQVADAAGGFLGLGKRIAAEEEAVLAELERAFD